MTEQIGKAKSTMGAGKTLAWRGIILLCIGLILVLFTGGCVSQNEYNALKDQNNELRELIEETNTNIANLKSQKEELKNKLEETNAQLQNAQDDLNSKSTQLENLQNELTEIQNKFPPKKFTDVGELDKWIESLPIYTSKSSDAVQWYKRALDIQFKALNDGYIINVELDSDDDVYYTVVCTAMLEDGSYYWWDPDTKDIYYWLDYRHF